MKKQLFLCLLGIVLLCGCQNAATRLSASQPEKQSLPPLNASEYTMPTGAPESLPPVVLPEEEAEATGAEASLHDTFVPDVSGDVVEIKEKMFIAQSNDIYLNPDDYLGKTIQYEGMFKSTYWPDEDETYYFVIRYGPGCCGYDGEAGFEVVWDGALPEEDDWCKAVGILEEYDIDGWMYLRLSLTSLTVLEERGAEYVYQ